MEPEEIVNQFNQDEADAQEQLLETVNKLEEKLDQDIDAEETFEQLNEEYRELSSLRTTFVGENEESEVDKPVKPLKQPTKDNYDGRRGLEAHEPDFLEHKQFLDGRTDDIMERAEEIYQRYREQSFLEPVEQVMDIPRELEELEEMKEEYEAEIFGLKNYLDNLRKVKNGEKQREEVYSSIPEDEDLVDDQIERTSRRIYESWQELNSKEERIKEAFGQMKEEDNEAIEMAIKYGMQPANKSVQRRENMLREFDRHWRRVGSTMSRDLPEKYSQRMT